MVRVTEGREVQAGAGEEAFEERGPVLHPPEPGFHQGGQLSEVALGQAGQGALEVGPDQLDGFEFVRVGRQTVSQSRAWISSVIAALTCELRLSQMTTSGPASCWCAASSSWAYPVSVNPLRWSLPRRLLCTR
jgi:hypothetical protein